MTDTTFQASMSCDNCGHHSRARLPRKRFTITMHDGREVLPANGRAKCPGCQSRLVWTDEVTQIATLMARDDMWDVTDQLLQAAERGDQPMLTVPMQCSNHSYLIDEELAIRFECERFNSETRQHEGRPGILLTPLGHEVAKAAEGMLRR
jgi:predicted Zn-ribbon and HTH transcriptional regulator